MVAAAVGASKVVGNLEATGTTEVVILVEGVTALEVSVREGRRSAKG